MVWIPGRRQSVIIYCVLKSFLNSISGPAVGIEVNGVEIFDSCSDVRSSLNIAQSELHISNSKEAAQSEIDAFYNFVDMSMS